MCLKRDPGDQDVDRISLTDSSLPEPPGQISGYTFILPKGKKNHNNVNPVFFTARHCIFRFTKIRSSHKLAISLLAQRKRFIIFQGPAEKILYVSWQNTAFTPFPLIWIHSTHREKEACPTEKPKETYP